MYRSKYGPTPCGQTKSFKHQSTLYKHVVQWLFHCTLDTAQLVDSIKETIDEEAKEAHQKIIDTAINKALEALGIDEVLDMFTHCRLLLMRRLLLSVTRARVKQTFGVVYISIALSVRSSVSPSLSVRLLIVGIFITISKDCF